MGRARGANAKLAGAFESVYGTTPASGTYFGLPFVSSNLGAEQPLLESDLLGNGRESYDPTYDVVTNDGDVVVPVDVRYFGYWLKLLLGAPATSGGDPDPSVHVFTSGAASTPSMAIETQFPDRPSYATSYGLKANQLRIQMQEELRRLQRELGNTFVFVTHDQGEAMSMSDRIAVMNDGKIVQLGSPEEIYEHPANRFVASFIGHMNLLEGKVSAIDGPYAAIDCGGFNIEAAHRQDVHGAGSGERIARLGVDRLPLADQECTHDVPLLPSHVARRERPRSAPYRENDPLDEGEITPAEDEDRRCPRRRHLERDPVRAEIGSIVELAGVRGRRRDRCQPRDRQMVAVGGEQRGIERGGVAQLHEHPSRGVENAVAVEERIGLDQQLDPTGAEERIARHTAYQLRVADHGAISGDEARRSMEQRKGSPGRDQCDMERRGDGAPRAEGDEEPSEGAVKEQEQIRKRW